MVERYVIIPGGEGRVFPVYKDEFIIVTDVEGEQVADLIVFNLHEPYEFLSTGHSCTMSGRVTLHKGQILYSNYRNALLKLVEDTVGIHDMLFPCCDAKRYSLDFGIDGHRNCRDNFSYALKEYGFEYRYIPDPINLFQNTPLNPDGTLVEAQAPKSGAGDHVVFKALDDILIGISACPQDQTPLCGWNITDIRAEIKLNL